MSSEWPLRSLGELTVNHDGKRRPVKEPDRKAGPYPYYGASGVVDHVDGFLFDGEYLLIGEDGENMRTRQTPIAFMAKGKFWVNNHAHIVTGNHLADTRYLMYAVSNADIHSYLTGAVMPKLTQGNLNKIQLPCPPVTIQREIVGVLGTLDDRITLLRETNATLEGIAQALFKSWFVDFDPVRAKTEGRLPDGMDEATAALFPDSFDETEVGLVPKGWKVQRVGDVLEARNERVNNLVVSEYSSTNNGLEPRDARFKKQLSASTSKNKVIRHGDLVFGLSRAVLNFGQMNDEIGSVSSAYKVFKVDETQINPQLLGRLISTRKEYFFNAVSASSREGQSISTDSLGYLKFVQPPKGVQKMLAETMQPLVGRIELILKKIDTLCILRDILLPRLISGQLRIPEALEDLEAA